MAKIRRVDFSPDEWIAGTRELTLEERGAYWDVCALIYSRGGPIADDEAWIAKALLCHVRTWRTIRTRLIKVGKLASVDGQLINLRTLREIERAEGRLKSSRKAADLSAKTRRERAENAELSNDYNDIPEAAASDYGGAIQQRATSNEHNPLLEEKDSLAQRAKPLPGDWRPTDDLIDRARKIRPDIQPARLDLETRGFIARMKADNRHSHDWGESWIGWILKTKIEEHCNGPRPSRRQTEGSAGESATTAGIAAAFARRSVQPG